MNIYLEVSVHKGGVYIYDHTHFIEMFENIAKAWEIVDMRSRFKFDIVRGKEITYHIMGFKNYDESKRFAIWYHVAKASGNIRAYRLD